MSPLTSIIYYCEEWTCGSYLLPGLFHSDHTFAENTTLDLGNCPTCSHALAVVDPSIDTYLTMSLHGLI
jgi:hypothetical protein